MWRRLLFVSLIALIGCNPFSYSEKDLVGKWDAVLLIQEQDTMDYDLSLVSLNFAEDNSYQYQSNLAEREAGAYYLLGKILYTKDTTATQPVEKAVQIELLKGDSLHILMRSEEGLQQLQLIRAGE